MAHDQFIFCRLLVNLTNPALLLYREEVPVERTARHNYLLILLHLQSYKEEAFTKVETWNVFAKKLAKVLEIVSWLQILILSLSYNPLNINSPCYLLVYVELFLIIYL